MAKKRYDYDAVIIGAGIGGLVCGCYLAKAGFKTLIVEKNHQVGGYCSSFFRDEIMFDACVESLGACAIHNPLGMIMNELGVDKKIKLLTEYPVRKIITKTKKIIIPKDINEFVDNLKRNFFEEKINLDNFFEFVINTPYAKQVIKLRNDNFEAVLKSFFSQKELIEFFSFLMLDSIGLPANLISAVTAVITLKYFFLDGGYYPEGGMQNFSNSFAQIFKASGGKILLNSTVEKILLEKNNAKSILTGKRKISSELIISNIDLRHTLIDLIGADYFDGKIINKIRRMSPSASAFLVYGVLKKKINISLIPRFVNLNIGTENIYSSIVHPNPMAASVYLSCFINNYNKNNMGTPLVLTTGVSFCNNKFWDKNKVFFAEKMIKSFCEWTGVNKRDVELKDTATPISLKKWTGSFHGAVGGWDPLVEQTFPNFNLSANIKGLYFVGHWLGMGHGIATVAYLGKRLANELVK